MLKSTFILHQPSKSIIVFNKLIKYLRVGWMLHFACIFSVIIFLVGFNNAQEAASVSFGKSFFIWLYISSFGLTVFVISLIDAYGRFQNYKQMKDLFYEYGFDSRLIKPFMFSQCQRNAVLEASISTNYKTQTKNYFNELGYKWYHILPDAFVKNPLVLFKVVFWKKILVTKHYKFKNFYW